MKKALLIIFIVLLSMFLLSCGYKDSPPLENNEPQEPPYNDNELRNQLIMTWNPQSKTKYIRTNLLLQEFVLGIILKRLKISLGKIMKRSIMKKVTITASLLI